MILFGFFLTYYSKVVHIFFLQEIIDCQHYADLSLAAVVGEMVSKSFFCIVKLDPVIVCPTLDIDSL